MKPLIVFSILTGLMMSLIPSSGLGDSLNGQAGSMPAYYDGELFSINLKQVSDHVSDVLRQNNGSINAIYASDQLLPGGEMFVSVLDAIQGDGFNPLWVEVQVQFNPGHEPRQLKSDTDIGAAAAAGEISLLITDEVYRCSVIGKP